MTLFMNLQKLFFLLPQTEINKIHCSVKFEVYLRVKKAYSKVKNNNIKPYSEYKGVLLYAQQAVFHRDTYIKCIVDKRNQQTSPMGN